MRYKEFNLGLIGLSLGVIKNINLPLLHDLETTVVKE